MSLQTRLNALVAAIGADIKALQNIAVSDAAGGWRGTAFPVSNNSWSTNIPLTVDLFDTNTMHDPAVNPERVLIKKSARYVVAANTRWDAAGGFRQVAVYKNDATELFSGNMPAVSGDLSYLTATRIVDLAAGDYLTLRAYQNSGATINISVAALEVGALGMKGDKGDKGDLFPTRVTALPSSPVDGQEIYLVVDVAGTYGGPYMWHCRYQAAIVDAYKWEVLSGHPLALYIDDSNAQHQATAWSAAKTPSIAAPFAGVYDSIFQFVANGSSIVSEKGALAAFQPTNVGNADVQAAATQLAPNTRYYMPSTRHIRRYTVAQNQVFSTYMRMESFSGSELFSCIRRQAELLPVRIG